MRERLKKRLSGPFLFFACLYGALTLFAAGCTDSLIFPAPRASYDGYLPGLVKIPDSDGGEIAALWMPYDGSTTAILYFHGNGEDLGHIRPSLEEIRRETGCSVLAVDYPGYGLSTGKASEAGCYEAADRALERLSSEYGYRTEHVVVFGRSLGTGVAVDVASRKKVKGLILLAPFTSTFRVVTQVKMLPVDSFDNLAKIGKVTCPLFVAHGDVDEVVPYQHGRDLFEAATGTKDKAFLMLRGAHHNDLIPPVVAGAYWDGIRRVAGVEAPGI